MLAPSPGCLGADTIWVTGDAAFDRFRTPRPELVADLFAGASRPRATRCLRRPSGATSRHPDGRRAVARPTSRVGQPVPPSSSCPVDDPIGVVRAKDDVVLVAGSGDGLVDAAAAGLIDGHELIRYTGSLGDDLRHAASTTPAR